MVLPWRGFPSTHKSPVSHQINRPVKLSTMVVCMVSCCYNMPPNILLCIVLEKLIR